MFGASSDGILRWELRKMFAASWDSLLFVAAVRIRHRKFGFACFCKLDLRLRRKFGFAVRKFGFAVLLAASSDSLWFFAGWLWFFALIFLK